MTEHSGTGGVGASDVVAAARRCAEVIRPSPLHRSERLSARYGFDVWLKREDQQAVRSYKARGAYNLIAQLSAEERRRGVVCASAGNHGQGVALACASLGVPARVYLPRTTPRQKRDRVRALGGEHVRMIVEGDTYDDAAAAAIEYTHASGATLVPAFDDPRTIAGQGTVVGEAVEQNAQWASEQRYKEAMQRPDVREHIAEAAAIAEAYDPTFARVRSIHHSHGRRA